MIITIDVTAQQPPLLSVILAVQSEAKDPAIRLHRSSGQSPQEDN